MRRRHAVLLAFAFAALCVAYLVWRNLP